MPCVGPLACADPTACADPMACADPVAGSLRRSHGPRRPHGRQLGPSASPVPFLWPATIPGRACRQRHVIRVASCTANDRRNKTGPHGGSYLSRVCCSHDEARSHDGWIVECGRQRGLLKSAPVWTNPLLESPNDDPAGGGTCRRFGTRPPRHAAQGRCDFDFRTPHVKS